MSRQDRLCFGYAVALLVGLTGCTPEHAGDALLTVAGQLDVPPAGIAPLFLERVMTLEEGESEAFVTRLEDAARAAGRSDRPGSGSSRPERAAALRWNAPHPGAPPGRPGAGQLTAAPIFSGDLRGVTVGGDLDFSTVPLLADTLAEVYRIAPPRSPTSAPAFLLDLADLVFLDAAGLRALAGVYDETGARGDHLHVAAPIAAAPRRLLRLAVGRGWLAPVFDRTAPGESTGRPPRFRRDDDA